jgi:hypothetical protein
MEREIQDFLGWIMALDQKRFADVLLRAGHNHPGYHKEKWAEFQHSPLSFVWNWTPEFVDAWKSEKKGVRNA